MPTVGKKKFPYTSKGKRAATTYAKRTGKKVKRAKKY
jgi:formylmethanofuran dehydrogenase subunit E